MIIIRPAGQESVCGENFDMIFSDTKYKCQTLRDGSTQSLALLYSFIPLSVTE